MSDDTKDWILMQPNPRVFRFVYVRPDGSVIKEELVKVPEPDVQVHIIDKRKEKSK